MWECNAGKRSPGNVWWPWSLPIPWSEEGGGDSHPGHSNKGRIPVSSGHANPHFPSVLIYLFCFYVGFSPFVENLEVMCQTVKGKDKVKQNSIVKVFTPTHISPGSLK